MSTMRSSLLVVLAMAVVVAACTLPEENGVVDDDIPDDIVLDDNQEFITRAMFGTTWPFTIEEAILTCENGAVWVEVDGVGYALNQAAEALGHEKLAPIWAPAPGPTQRMSTVPVMQRGIRLC